MESGLIKHKYSVYQRLRKFFILRKLQKVNISYNELPKYLKNDKEVIIELINQNFENIYDIPDEMKSMILAGMQDHELNYQIGKSRVHPELIRYLSVDRQIELLEKLSRIDSNIVNTLDDNTMKIIAQQHKGLAKKILLNIQHSNIKKLSDETQALFIGIDNSIEKYCSQEAVRIFKGNNPLLNKRINTNETTQAEMHRWARKNDIYESKKNILAARIPNDHLSGQTIISNTGNAEFIWEMAKINPKYDEIMIVKDVTPKDISLMTRNLKIIEDIIKAFNKQYGNNNCVSSMLRGKKRESYWYRNTNCYNLENAKKESYMANVLLKFALAKDILSKNSPEDLLQFAQEPTHNMLVKIVKSSYGEKAAQILEDRPNVDINLIPNFDIFSPEVIEEFGIGAIHSVFTYNTPNLAMALGELGRNIQTMSLYKIYNSVMGDRYENTAYDLQKKLEDFFDCIDLIKNMDFTQLTNKEVKTLSIISNDRIRNNEVLEFPRSKEELDSYIERRNRIYDEAIKKTTDITAKKNLLMNKIFGVPYDAIFFGHYEHPISYLNHSLSINDFISNSKTLNSDRFSEDELDLLEILTIMDEINSPQILDELANEFEREHVILNPDYLRKTIRKVQETYNQDIVENLMTPEKMVEEWKKNILRSINEEDFNWISGLEEEQQIQHLIDVKKALINRGTRFEDIGFEIEVIDGIIVITLTGVEFNACVHIPGKANSEQVNATIENGKWLEQENGLSTISTSIFTDKTVDLTANGKLGTTVGYGYSGNLNPEQIMGVFHTDARTSHKIRDLDPKMAIKYRYMDEFITEINRRDNFRNSYFWNYTEATLWRNRINLKKVKEGTYGGKYMPDYIYGPKMETKDNVVRTAKKRKYKVWHSFE